MGDPSPRPFGPPSPRGGRGIFSQ